MHIQSVLPTVKSNTYKFVFVISTILENVEYLTIMFSTEIRCNVSYKYAMWAASKIEQFGLTVAICIYYLCHLFTVLLNIVNICFMSSVVILPHEGASPPQTFN